MKKTSLVILAFTMLALSFSCSAQSDPGSATLVSENKAEIGVYYFHFSRRCATCIGVEENSKKAVEELYPEQVKTGEYFFKGVNLDEPEGMKIGKEMGIGMQTLLVVHGDKRVDITGEGFMYAENYERLKAEVKKAVDKALKL